MFEKKLSFLPLSNSFLCSHLKPHRYYPLDTFAKNKKDGFMVKNLYELFQSRFVSKSLKKVASSSLCLSGVSAPLRLAQLLCREAHGHLKFLCTVLGGERAPDCTASSVSTCSPFLQTAWKKVSMFHIHVSLARLRTNFLLSFLNKALSGKLSQT